MKTNLKSEKGAITLIVLIAMLFLMGILMSMYINIANQAKTSAETTKQIQQQYNNLDEVNSIYDSYFAQTDVIPIYTKEQLKKIGSGEQITIDGKIYIFSSNAYYTLKNDLDLGGYYDETTKTWTAEEGDEWTPLPLTDSQGNKYKFLGTLDGLGHTISGMYINNSESTNQGLFGVLEGTVKNLRIVDGYINGLSSIGAIAGTNNGTITNCYDNAIILALSTDNGKIQVNEIWYNSLEDYKNLNPISGQIVEYNKIPTDENGMLITSARYTSGNSTAIIPKGFNISRTDEEQDIATGLVIENEQGNQFVWVEVPKKIDVYTKTGLDIENFTDEEYVSIENDLKEYTKTYRNNTSNSDTYYSDQATGLENSKYTELKQKMLKSIYQNGGFYIGRYETGTYTARTDKGDDLSTAVIHANVYPYNYVTCSQAQSLASGFASGEYTSSLMFGIQWDLVLRYLQAKGMTEEELNLNSTSWGNYKTNPWNITNDNSKYYENSKWNIGAYGKNQLTGEGVLLSTGADDSFSKQQIYDIGGNVREWTLETTNADSPCVLRGGNYTDDGSEYQASYRHSASTINSAHISGFRVVIY